MSDPVRLVDIRDEPLDAHEMLDTVADPSAGGQAVFVGVVRDHDSGKRVERLEYSAHPTAMARLRSVAERVADAHPVVALAVVHRTGELKIGDLAVVVAVSTAHRGDAFSACRQLIDDLKAEVPIWKHQQFTDGSDEWVGTP